MEKNKKIRRKTRDCIWIRNDIIDPNLTEEDLKNIINHKLAYIIVEMEHSPINYIKLGNVTEGVAS